MLTLTTKLLPASVSFVFSNLLSAAIRTLEEATGQ